MRCVLTSLLITVRLCRCSFLISLIAVCVLCSTSVPVNIYWTLQVWGMKSTCKDSNSVADMFYVVWLLDRCHSHNVASCCRKIWSYYSWLWKSWIWNSGEAKFLWHPGWVSRMAKRLRWSRGSVLPSSTQVDGFKPGRSCQDFSGRKNPQHAFGREVSHGSRVADLRHVKDPWIDVEVAISCKITGQFSPTQFHLSLPGSLTSSWMWGYLAANVGTSKQAGGG